MSQVTTFLYYYGTVSIHYFSINTMRYARRELTNFRWLTQVLQTYITCLFLYEAQSLKVSSQSNNSSVLQTRFCWNCPQISPFSQNVCCRFVIIEHFNTHLHRVCQRTAENTSRNHISELKSWGGPWKVLKKRTDVVNSEYFWPINLVRFSSRFEILPKWS